MTKKETIRQHNNLLEAYTKENRQTVGTRPSEPVISLGKREKNVTVNVRASYHYRLKLLSIQSQKTIQKVAEELIDKACRRKGI